MGISKVERQLQFVPQRYLRRGVFSSVDLSSSIYSALPELVCVVKIPDAVSKEVNGLLSRGEKFPFGIQPTPFEDFRIFDIHLLGQDYVGVLVDLPCNIEVYKSLDCESMFKSNNLSQMLYIYDANSLPKWFITSQGLNTSSIYKGPMKSNVMYSDQTFVSFIKYLKESLQWEWPAGLLPASRGVRSRKYRNTELFDIGEVIEAEQELLDRVSMPSQDMVTIDVVSTKEMDEQIHLFKHEQKNSPFPIASVFDKKKKATCMGIIGKDDDLRGMISRFKREDSQKKGAKQNTLDFEDIQSDISDVIFRESSDDENNPNNISEMEPSNSRISEENSCKMTNREHTSSNKLIVSNDFSLNEDWDSHDSSSDD
ncbi:TAF7-like RNA polymerase II TAF7L [Cryptosporidium sp. chipmunk genotype I]|uniref:TAF7-like RNA polymerase II TAF7L n=1 Tax=Cryptosporidium sp. chipmunk genotype I TaxID=1280935 RepID=UPI00351A3D76|nr:TAF7-like RNA polymerase II TAF7L [Cryptosporidium sp. chipmunk genotype I]